MKRYCLELGLKMISIFWKQESEESIQLIRLRDSIRDLMIFLFCSAMVRKARSKWDLNSAPRNRKLSMTNNMQVSLSVTFTIVRSAGRARLSSQH